MPWPSSLALCCVTLPIYIAPKASNNVMHEQTANHKKTHTKHNRVVPSTLAAAADNQWQPRRSTEIVYSLVMVVFILFVSAACYRDVTRSRSRVHELNSRVHANLCLIRGAFAYIHWRALQTTIQRNTTRRGTQGVCAYKCNLMHVEVWMCV